MATLIAKAKGHLRDALAYCTTLPAAAYRIRIFCLTSLYFAVRTLRLAERDPRLLDPSHKVKITRADVYRTVAAAHLVAPFDALARGYYLRLAGEG
jgi:farnesyl-diphosphate farnesyltransferase